VRTAVERDDARPVIELLQDDDVAGGLQELERPLVEHARDAAEEAARVRVDVFPFRDVGVVLEDLGPLRPRPRLVGDLAVGRIDDEALLVGLVAAEEHVRRVGAGLDVVGRQPSSLVGPEALDVRLAVGRSRRGRCRATAARGSGVEPIHTHTGGLSPVGRSNAAV